MIQSSLENLQLSQNDQNAAEDPYVSRALEGT
jgi:two-component system, OmpR family, sensor histidine kinase ChvG